MFKTLNIKTSAKIKNLFRTTIPISEVFNSLHYYFIIKKRELKIWVEQESNIFIIFFNIKALLKFFYFTTIDILYFLGYILSK